MLQLVVVDGMFRRLEQRSTEWALRKVEEHLCPSTISRSGPDGERVDCYVCHIDRPGFERELFVSIDGDHVISRTWDGGKFGDEKRVPLADVRSRSLSITHYYGLAEIYYKGSVDFVCGRFFRIPYLLIRGAKLRERGAQYLFNRKDLVAKKRSNILRACVDLTLEHAKSFPLERNEGVSPVVVTTRIYGDRWISHPDGEARLNEVSLYLNGLVDTEELQRAGGRYVVTGHGLESVEITDERERNHRAERRLQGAIVAATLGLLVAALLQTDLIKLPTWIDWASSPPVDSQVDGDRASRP